MWRTVTVEVTVGEKKGCFWSKAVPVSWLRAAFAKGDRGVWLPCLPERFSHQPHFLAVMPDGQVSVCISDAGWWGHRCAPPVESSLSAAARAPLGCREARRPERARSSCSHFCVGSLGAPQPVLPSFVAWSLAGEPEHHLRPSTREARRELLLHITGEKPVDPCPSWA